MSKHTVALAIEFGAFAQFFREGKIIDPVDLCELNFTNVCGSLKTHAVTEPSMHQI